MDHSKLETGSLCGLVGLVDELPRSEIPKSFNDKLRDECLSMEWFKNRVDARVTIEHWRRDYNAVRPHSSFGYLTPWEFIRKTNQAAQRAILQF